MARDWSSFVTKFSNALDLDKGVFTWDDPKDIAQSLKSSADQSDRRKGTSRQSSMSMLNFYINRGGSNIDPQRKQVLEQAKVELRKLYDQEAQQ